jgi:hypothetical protein
MATPERGLSPPRAAAAAGIVFSVLLSISIVVIRLAVPSRQTDAGEWLADPVERTAVRFAIQLMPFAGIAFLWFIGVLRNRLGKLEDQFFATVFLGSGVLFVASLFGSAVLAGALLRGMDNSNAQPINADVYRLVRQIIHEALNAFALRMAGVFIMSTSTIVLRTRILPRWIAFSGFVCAGVLLLISTSWPWISMLFPLWMMVVSCRILLADIGGVKKSRARA